MKHAKDFKKFKEDVGGNLSNFVVGRIYRHPKYGKFEVVALTQSGNTKIKWMEGPSIGEIATIAGQDADGYLYNGV